MCQSQYISTIYSTPTNGWNNEQNIRRRGVNLTLSRAPILNIEYIFSLNHFGNVSLLMWSWGGKGPKLKLDIYILFSIILAPLPFWSGGLVLKTIGWTLKLAVVPQNDPHFYLTHIFPLLKPLFNPILKSYRRFLHLLCANGNLWLCPMTTVPMDHHDSATFTYAISCTTKVLSHGLRQSFSMFTCFATVGLPVSLGLQLVLLICRYKRSQFWFQLAFSPSTLTPNFQTSQILGQVSSQSWSIIKEKNVSML